MQLGEAPQEPADFDQVWAVEPEPSFGVLGLGGQGSPVSAGSLPELLGEAFATEIEVSESRIRQLGRRPDRTLVLVTDVARVVTSLGYARMDNAKEKETSGTGAEPDNATT